MHDGKGYEMLTKCSAKSHAKQKKGLHPIAFHRGLQTAMGRTLLYFDCPICGSTLALEGGAIMKTLNLATQKIAEIRRNVLKTYSAPEPSQEDLYGHLGKESEVCASTRCPCREEERKMKLRKD